jgi:hypothetical protein
VAGAGVVGVGVRDDGARNRADRVDEEIAWGAVEAFGADGEPGFGVGHGGGVFGRRRLWV